MIQLPPNQFGAIAALTAITKHLDKQIEKAFGTAGAALNPPHEKTPESTSSSLCEEDLSGRDSCIAKAPAETRDAVCNKPDNVSMAASGSSAPPAQTNLNTVPVLAEPRTKASEKGSVSYHSSEARESNLGRGSQSLSDHSRDGVQTLSNVQHQEVVIDAHRFGEGGEPLTLRVLCCAHYSNERDWEAFPDGEVVETRGDYKAGEVIHLTLEELDEVKREGEREYSRE